MANETQSLDLTTEEIKRFWSKYNVGSVGECWERKDGQFRPAEVIRGKTYVAARAAYMIEKGPIPAKMCACHTCDNGFCVNPNHIWLGTHQENMADRALKGRDGENLSDADRMEIARRFDSGETVPAIAADYHVSPGRMRQVLQRIGYAESQVYRGLHDVSPLQVNRRARQYRKANGW